VNTSEYFVMFSKGTSDEFDRLVWPVFEISLIAADAQRAGEDVARLSSLGRKIGHESGHIGFPVCVDACRLARKVRREVGNVRLRMGVGRKVAGYQRVPPRECGHRSGPGLPQELPRGRGILAASFAQAGVPFAATRSPRTGAAATVSGCVAERRLWLAVPAAATVTLTRSLPASSTTVNVTFVPSIRFNARRVPIAVPASGS
jgi:hypothetical protein